MKVAGIVCEYNPMHNGHVYHIEKTREYGATHIACVMSGNFVQRGECAFADKWTRADIAVHCGADLVVELPVPWSCDSAENFAFAAVSILDSLGCDILSFGSETQNTELIVSCAQATLDSKISKCVKEKVSSGMSYPSALQLALGENFSADVAQILSLPNSTLAVEYIKSIKKIGSKMAAYAVKRAGVNHDEAAVNGKFASAAMLRSESDLSRIGDYMPAYAFEKLSQAVSSGYAPCKEENAERAVLSTLRQMSNEEMKTILGEARGLTDRIFAAVKSSQSLNELYAGAKTKNVTYAAVKRSVLRLFLGIDKGISLNKPPYIRVLAANGKGIEIIKNSAGKIPVVTKHSDISLLSSEAQNIYDIQCRSTDLFALFSKKIRACSLEQTSPVNILQHR